MASRVKILCFSGSTRAESLNKKLAKLAVREIDALGAVATYIDLADFPMPLYNGDLEIRDGVPDHAIDLKEMFMAHQGIFIASPEYNAGYSPLLKNTLDWITRVSVEGEKPQAAFKDRIFAISAASTGSLGGIRALPLLRQTLTAGYGALVIPEQIALTRASDAFDENGDLIEAHMASMFRAQISRLVELAAFEKA